MSEGQAEGDAGAAANGGAAQSGSGGGDWRATIPADIRNDPVFQTFKGPEDVYKSYHSARRQLSTRASMVDLDPPTDEGQRKAVLAKLGHSPPESADKYNLPDKPTAAQFREQAFKHGLTVKQAEAWYADLDGAQARSDTERQQRMENRAKEADTALRAEWGSEYEAKMELRNLGMEKAIPEDARKILEATGLDKHPAFMKHFSDVGRAYKEGQMHTGSGGGSAGGGTVEAKWDAIQVFHRENASFINSQNLLDPQVKQAHDKYNLMIREHAEASIQAEQGA